MPQKSPNPTKPAAAATISAGADNIRQLRDAVAGAGTILILQPDNPDSDSLGSALALEEILGDLGKQVVMYSYKEPDSYLHSFEGWDRVVQKLPRAFGLTILVDAGTPALIKSMLAHHAGELTAKPVYIIDHHLGRGEFGFTTTDIIQPAAASAEIITQICLDLDWPINPRAAAKLAAALLADSLGLTTPDTTARTVEMLAELVRRGANLFQLHKSRREASALTPQLLRLKGKLLESVVYHADDQVAVAVIEPDTILQFQDLYDPGALIMNDMQWVKGVELVAIFKNYGGKINVRLRSATGVAGPIAEQLGGGGHSGAAAYRCASPIVTHEINSLIDAFKKYKASHETL
jgi:nanoRNase/pAp phosphatase (c-di-AMP/oligoRNAs hydrolase)